MNPTLSSLFHNAGITPPPYQEGVQLAPPQGERPPSYWAATGQNPYIQETNFHGTTVTIQPLTAPAARSNPAVNGQNRTLHAFAERACSAVGTGGSMLTAGTWVVGASTGIPLMATGEPAVGGAIMAACCLLGGGIATAAIFCNNINS